MFYYFFWITNYFFTKLLTKPANYKYYNYYNYNFSNINFIQTYFRKIYKLENQDKEILTFRELYSFYEFFKLNSSFNGNFKKLNLFFNFKQLFVLFYFYYNFLYLRLNQLNTLKKGNSNFNVNHYNDLFFFCFYFIKKLKLSNFNFNNQNSLAFANNFNGFKNFNSNNLEIKTNFKKNNINKYNKIFEKYFKIKKFFFFKNKINLILKKLNTLKIKINHLNKKYNKSYKIVFSNTFMYKYISTQNINSYNILFLRKNRVFNKGRYSRNRQNYRTGVYWCLYVNIVATLTIYYFFYRFSLNFGYLWWLFAAGINCFFFSKFFKYKLYYLSNFINIFKNIFTTYSYFFNLILNLFIKNKMIILFYNNFILENRLTNRIIFYFLNFYSFLLNFLRKIV